MTSFEILTLIISLVSCCATTASVYLISKKDRATAQASHALTVYKIDQLESKVNKHNNLIERMYKLEEKQMVMEEQIKVANHRIDDFGRND